MSYYTKITTAGLAAITAAMNNSSKVPITYMAFGDGNGYIPEPDENANSLVNEVYRVGVNKVEVHNKNPNWLVCEAIIPSAVGGFNIREVALYDSTGATMLAIASYPPTYKPTVEEGAAKIQTIRIVIQVDNTGNFELIIDPDVVLATVDYVNNQFKFKWASIEDFGASENKTALENSLAINNALQSSMHVYFPHGKTYEIDFDLINVRSNQKVYGGATLQGRQTVTTGADGRGVFLKMRQVENVYIEGLTIKNGYRGRLIECNNSKNIHFKNVTLDGGTYNLWCGETNIGTEENKVFSGSQNIIIEDCKFLNARYWGCYVRGWGVTDDLLKTQNIKIIRPYIYNASMAGLVLSEGHVYNVLIDSPYFERCNVCCHFEESTHTTMIGFKDKDTGKKPDHEPANTEYPFENYSLYTAFSSDTTIFGGKFSKHVYHFSIPDRPSRNYKYFGSEIYEVIYEAAGLADTNKVTFQDYIFDGVTSERLLGWQNSGASHYLRGFVFNNCKVLNDNDSVSRLGLILPRTVDLTVTNCLFKNSKFELYSEGVMKVTGNRVTNKNIAVVCEINGVDQASSIGEFTGNYFFNGNSNLGYYAIRVRNFKHFKYQGTTVAKSNVAVAFGNIDNLVWGYSITEGATEKPYNLANVTTVIDESKPDLAPTVTTSDLANINHSINNKIKYVGRTVYNSTDGAFYKSVGSSQNSTWIRLDDKSVTIIPTA